MSVQVRYQRFVAICTCPLEKDFGAHQSDGSDTNMPNERAHKVSDFLSFCLNE